METRRVFVVWTHPLFYEAVRLLLDDPSIDLVGANPDYAAAHEHIMKLQPDTIIVEEKEGNLSAEVFAFLRDSPMDARIIGLNLSDNQLFVYHRERQTVGRANDLLRLVQGFQS
jgi:AmiR/NasT family two-component response regulator